MRRMGKSSCFTELGELFDWCCGHAEPGPGPEVDMKFDLRLAPDGRPRGSHSRIAALLSHIAASGVHGLQPLLATIQVFVDQGGFGGSKSYLKISGGRADKLDEAAQSRLLRAGEVGIEFGTFIGTTAIRLADQCARAAETLNRSRVVQIVTFEVEPVHTAVARWLVDLAGMSWAVEVWPGLGGDSALRAADEFGRYACGLVFLDHRGTKFHTDLAGLEQLQLLAPRALVIADSVLRPGAPQFLWHVHTSSSYEDTTWAFMDSTPFPGEDWMTVAVYGGGMALDRPCSPPSLERLSWDSDRWRRKSQEGGLRVSDWSAFAQHAAQELARCGIEARPWLDPNAAPAPAAEGSEAHESEPSEQG